MHTDMVRVATGPVVKSVEVVVAGTTRHEQALLSWLLGMLLTPSRQLLYRHSVRVQSIGIGS